MLYFQICFNDSFVSLKTKGSILTLNVDKTDVTKFGTNSKTSINTNIGYNNKTTLF
jgi:uncharacterized protein YhjY with autotransporter beta-barrel domain